MDAIDRINKDSEAVRNWSEQFGVGVNVSKCQSIILGNLRMMSRTDTSKLPIVIYNGSIVPVSLAVKHLRPID